MNLSELCSEEEYVILSQIDAGLASDWLIEHGIWPESMTIQRKLDICINSYKFIYGYHGGSIPDNGRGNGLGSCNGRGTGYGSVNAPNGGGGSGLGSCIGHGSNFVISSSTSKLKLTRSVVKIGKNYLIVLGDMQVIVGTVVEMTCPGVFILEEASKIDIREFRDRHRWSELADGNISFRNDSRYWHYVGEVSVSYLLATEWVGKLPAHTFTFH